MQDTASVNLLLRLFPAVMCGLSSNRLAPAVANRSNGRQDHFQTDAAGGTPATASHARMTMTVTGLPSRRQESEAFPCQLRRPFDFPVARCAISHTSPFSFPSLQVYANVPMPPFQTASVVIFVAGAKVKTGLGTQIFSHNLHTSQAQVVFCRKKFAEPTP